MVLYYAPIIFEQSGIGTDMAFLNAIWIGVLMLVFAPVAMYYVDRVGRRPLVLLGIMGISLGLLICSLGFASAQYSITEEASLAISQVHADIDLKELTHRVFNSDVEFKNAVIEHIGSDVFLSVQSVLMSTSVDMNSWPVLVGIVIFISSFAISLGPVTKVLLSEIFPIRNRATFGALVGIIMSVFSYIVQIIFPWQLNNMGVSMTFLVYGGIGFACFISMYLYLPETRQKSLEQIEKEFSGIATTAS